jgi:hypothetical protein
MLSDHFSAIAIFHHSSLSTQFDLAPKIHHHILGTLLQANICLPSSPLLLMSIVPLTNSSRSANGLLTTTTTQSSFVWIRRKKEERGNDDWARGR